ncbi:MAG: hypothetical protein HY544_02520 [Candidatus Diapherotrites archaeon]|uniref:Uncharacterized protein n=1 Tax=Candidatus Iainarchaeum sp. TaxID=3101447 RepID=A0A8T3YMU3_9ARCH|nr:hypothetical protein [Candidatus Diapherotrites archaeon]
MRFFKRALSRLKGLKLLVRAGKENAAPKTTMGDEPARQAKPAPKPMEVPAQKIGIVADADSGQHSLIPSYTIKVGERSIGYIMRGHRNILVDEFKGRGLFFKALALLEGKEREFFRQGMFMEYKLAIMEVCEREDYPAMERAFIAGIGRHDHTHIDFTRLTSITRSLIVSGYELSPPSLVQLEKLGLRSNASRQEITRFLKASKQLDRRIRAYPVRII